MAAHQRLFEHCPAAQEEQLPQLSGRLEALGTERANIEARLSQRVGGILNGAPRFRGYRREAIVFKVPDREAFRVVERRCPQWYRRAPGASPRETGRVPVPVRRS